MLLSNSDNAILGQIAQFIIDNAAKRVLVQELVNLSGMSETKFNKAFRFKYQVSAHQLWLEASMNVARTMIENGASVKEAAIELGYKSRYSFRTAFYNVHGIQPAQLKRS